MNTSHLSASSSKTNIICWALTFLTEAMSESSSFLAQAINCPGIDTSQYPFELARNLWTKGAMSRLAIYEYHDILFEIAQNDKRRSHVSLMSVRPTGSSRSSDLTSNADWPNWSGSNGSTTSTLEFGHEPFAEFRSRVKALCEVLWPPRQSRRQRISDSRFVSKLHLRPLILPLVPRPPSYQIERLRGGTFNRVIGVTVTDPKKKGYCNEFVIRIPRGAQARLDRELSALSFVRSRTSIPLAEATIVDFTDRSVVGSPYTIYKRVPGCDLSEVWDQLSHKQRMIVAQEVGNIFRTLMDVTSPVAGRIESFSKHRTGFQDLTVLPFALKLHGEIVEEPQYERLSDIPNSTATAPTADWFASQFGRWRALTWPHSNVFTGVNVNHWDRLIDVVSEMAFAGLFKADEFCFMHRDLFPRNMMGSIQEEDSLQIEAILDWDEAVFVPVSGCCEAPGWLWLDDYDDTNFDEALGDLYPYETEWTNKPPASGADWDIRDAFEKSVGSRYLYFAYRPEYRLVRILLRLAVCGLTCKKDLMAWQKLLSEWALLFPCMVPLPDERQYSC